MENIHRTSRSGLVLFFLSLLCPILGAQTTFQFTYTGPDTLYASADCTAPLEWGHPTTLKATCSYPGGDSCRIQSLVISDISGNYLPGQSVMAGEKVFITYEATDTSDQSDFFTFSLTIADTLPPDFDRPLDLTINCDQSFDPDLTGQPTNITDNCNPVADTNYIDIIVAGNCTYEYLIRRQWTVTDRFQNESAVQTQLIRVQDRLAPEFVDLPSDLSVSCLSKTQTETAFRDWLTSNAGGSATDNCTPNSLLFWFTAVPGSYQIDDPLSWPGIHPAELDPADCDSNPTGVYRTEIVDVVVYDECENAISRTVNFTARDDSPPQFTNCPDDLSFSTESNDCVVRLDLPSITFTDACSTDEVVFDFSIDGNPFILFENASSKNVELEAGDHEIIYRLSDCAGNTQLCTFFIRVTDSQAPEVQCPPDQTINLLATDDCSQGKSVTLPFIDGITDNCALDSFRQTQPVSVELAWLEFDYDTDFEDYVARDKTVEFVGVAANAVGDQVRLEVKLEGDVEETSGFYRIFGEGNILLGTTKIGQQHVELIAGDCQTNLPFTKSVFELPTGQFNQWAQDGKLEIQLVSNQDFNNNPPGIDGDGLNPYCKNFPAGTPDGTVDSLSKVQVSLRYARVVPTYSISGATQLPEQTMMLPSVLPVHEFQLGTSVVQYQISDRSGNTAACTFEVTVEDQTPPDVNCRSTTIFVNPSGGTPYELTPGEIDDGSSDNCGIVRREVQPFSFSCQIAGSIQSVVLIAEDAAGNVSECDAIVRVELQRPEPTYSVGLCGNDTLYLSANPPAAPPGFFYTYNWTGPNGFSSFASNPVIPNADASDSGTYTVTIQGVSGCRVSGTVEVSINAVPNTPVLQASKNELCTNDTLILSTTSYTGTRVNYFWYSGIFPGGSLIGTTTDPNFVIPPPQPTNSYFLIVEVDGCRSGASTPVIVQAFQAPMASVRQTNIQICEGGSFSVGTDISDPGFTYQWTGPNGFSSDLQNPKAIDPAALADAGDYQLIISNNGCASDPALAEVEVRPRPDQPVLFAQGTICRGENLSLSTNNNSADTYIWTAPNGETRFTTVSELVIFNVQTIYSGDWTVRVSEGSCESVESEPINVFVSDPPQAQIINNGPLCPDDSLRLEASVLPGAIYQWAGPGNFNALGNPVEGLPLAGNYRVTVTNTVGCTATFQTFVNVNSAPEITALSSNAPACADGSPVRLIPTIFPVDNGSYQYNWTGPNNFNSTAASPILPTGTAQDNGVYQLEVTNAEGCTSPPMDILVELNDAPLQPLIGGSEFVCEGNSLQLSTATYSGQQVRYFWQTPLGRDTTFVPQLTISPVNSIYTGDYFVQVLVDDCLSPVSAAFSVTVARNIPSPPLTTNSPVCSGDTIRLMTTRVIGGTYKWQGPNGFTSGEPAPVIANASETDEGSYRVMIEVNGCESPLSQPAEVVVNEAPQAPVLSNNGPICLDDPTIQLILTIDPSSATAGARYSWFDARDNRRIGGPTFSTSLILNNFTAYTEGVFDFYVIASLNGCDAPSAIPTSVQMYRAPAVEADAGEDQIICEQTEIRLTANDPTVGSGRWMQTDGPAVTIIDPDQFTTQVTGLILGNTYRFSWILSYATCLDYSRDEVTVEVIDSDVSADAGADFTDCGDGTTQLQAANSEGTWSSPDAGVNILDPDLSDTEVTGLSSGRYMFIWTVESDLCEAVSDTLIVDYEGRPVASDDVQVVRFGEATEFSLIGNDLIAAGFEITIIRTPSNGNVTYLGDGMVSYRPRTNFAGTDVFIYELCSENCPDICDEASVEVSVSEGVDCIAPTIFSPNGDSVNDFFEIPCLETGKYPANKVVIFNQWGDEVFRASPYQNDWAGTFQNEELPVGTYFYIIELGNGERPIDGFLILER